MNDFYQKLNRLKIEDFIWIIYFFIIGANLFENKLEREELFNSNINNKEMENNLNTTILIIAFIIYIYFVYRSYGDIKNLKQNAKSKKHLLANITFIGSLLFLVGGACALYVQLNNNSDDEIGIL